MRLQVDKNKQKTPMKIERRLDEKITETRRSEKRTQLRDGT